MAGGFLNIAVEPRLRIFKEVFEQVGGKHRHAVVGVTVGAFAPWIGRDARANIEVRAFISNRSAEDPVTDSLSASLAQWLIPAGLMPKRYAVSQGTALGRQGRIQVEQVGRIWVGGEVQKCTTGRVSF